MCVLIMYTAHLMVFKKYGFGTYLPRSFGGWATRINLAVVLYCFDYILPFTLPNVSHHSNSPSMLENVDVKYPHPDSSDFGEVERKVLTS